MLPDCDVVLVSSTQVEPIGMEEAKLQCRRVAQYTREDAWFDQAIAAARATIEGETGRQLRAQTTWTVAVRGFPCQALVLPIAPLRTVECVTYVDLAGETQTLPPSAYQVIAPSGDRASYGRIERAYGVPWPSTRGQAGAVIARIVAGYAVLPPALKSAALLLIGHWYAHRETVALGTISTEVELTFTSLVRHYRLYPMPVLA